MYTLENIGDKAVFRDTFLNVQFSVPKSNCLGMCETNPIEPIKKDSEIKKAFQFPVSGKSLSIIARERGCKTACIIISDATRGIPTSTLAALTIEELLNGGILLENIFFFVAIGVHRPSTEDEMKGFLGNYYGKVHIENHTPFDLENIIFLGKTSIGTPVSVNRRAYECDLHIQIGKVEPHEFAGFSGGRKSVLPGISSEKTIKHNHRPEMIMNPSASIGALENNPINIDMTEAAELFHIDFGVNCILNNEMQIAAVFTGGLVESHQAAVDFVRSYLSVRLTKPDILVITPGEPLDIDFYQTVKALISVTDILNEDIVTILYCGCKEGINSPDMFRAFKYSSNLEEVIEFATENYEIQMDHVLLLSKILRKNAKIILCCPNIHENDIRDMFMIPCKNPNEAINLACSLAKKQNPKVLFYPRPQTGLPVLQ